MLRHKVNPNQDNINKSYLKDEIFKNTHNIWGANFLKSQNLILGGDCQVKRGKELRHP